MTSRTRNARAAALTRFVTDDKQEDYYNDAQEEDENTMDIISLMQEYQKKKSMKASNRSAAFTGKKNALVTNTRKEADAIVHDGRVYIDQCKERVKQLREQETGSDDAVRDAMKLWSAHEEAFQSLLATYPELIEELSPYRAEVINAASEMLETHPLAREASRRRTMKNARKHIEIGMENQKLATDASALIKHYKALLLL